MSFLIESLNRKSNSKKAITSKKVPKNYYFIESDISPLILEWCKFYEKQKEIEEYIKNEKNEEAESGYYCITDTERESLEKEKIKVIAEASPLLNEIMESTYKVIKGVIFKAELQKREKYNTCFQIAVEACIKALPRFNPEYGTAFNYLSLTAKRSIIYYLIKKAKKRSLSLDYEYMDDDTLKLRNFIKQEERTLRNLEIENFTDTINNLIQEKSEHKSLSRVSKELREYLFYNQGIYEKKDFFAWGRSEGISSNLLRKFIKFLKENKDFLYREVGVY